MVHAGFGIGRFLALLCKSSAGRKQTSGTSEKPSTTCPFLAIEHRVTQGREQAFCKGRKVSDKELKGASEGAPSSRVDLSARPESCNGLRENDWCRSTVEDGELRSCALRV